MQELLYEVLNSKKVQEFSILRNSGPIQIQLNKITNSIKNLENNKSQYEQTKKEIENDIHSLQKITERKIIEIKEKGKQYYEKVYPNNYINDYTHISNSFFSEGTKLLDIKDFRRAENIFNSMCRSNISGTEDIYNAQNLIKKNYQVICHLKDNYDIYDINYELEVLNLPEYFSFNSSSFDFPLDCNIGIITFEINGKRAKYELDKYSLRFYIKLKNKESTKIHIKYKESPSVEKMTENEKNLRSLYRWKSYGISKRLVGQYAKFILKNYSNFEIINFKEDIFERKNSKDDIFERIKNKDDEKNKRDEYEWDGIVPENGRETMVRMSKKEATINFFELQTIKTEDNSNIKNTKIEMPLYYVYGNNKIIEYIYESDQIERRNLDGSIKEFKIPFFRLNTSEGRFIIQGKLNNKYRGGWIVNLTDKEIDSLIPPDFETNKAVFKKISNEIIKQYDKEHKDNLGFIYTINKIGTWVKNNIKHDITYTGRNDITATETYNSKRGVCHHITNLFNALMYSLGYKVLYILGYVVTDKKTFSAKDTHAWSLIKCNKKWLPFDATWGIFSGKLPVTHIYKQIGFREKKMESYDKMIFGPIEVEGNIS